MGQLSEAIQVKNVLDFYDIKNFVETGTGAAEVVRYVHDIDESLNIHTIEIIEEIYEKNKLSFSYLKDVNWHLGQSSEVLPTIISELEGNTLFWLDAHFPGADFGMASYGDEPNLEKRLPLQSELELIVNTKDIKDDVFVIDDLRIYEDGPFEDGSWEDRKKYGGDGIDFVHHMFEETHYLVRSYNKQGFIILLPLSRNIDAEAQNLVVGDIS